ncbi:protein involved in gliding motility EpsA [Winogradskyella wandonensis]|uniref:Protein involved in gliding motility EpsA n=1 Tax=Winogradskyella wandonensis TaxID=1442586 RepID=A0A4R1KUC4_9FLAO|nr:polysaccharide biosynthesis/export family protein [Winogradskyella wandonensis]TCK68805.1 protein involved in gliding motility EpsA [Winogradskyella wandonensis]
MIRYLLAICFLGLLFCTSCVPQKDIIYLQDKGNSNDTIPSLVEQQKPYRVQINDILNIRIKVLDQDDATIFNPTGEGDLQASPQERAYFDGFTVDLRGNIRVPQLGEFLVLNLTNREIEELIKTRLLEKEFNEFAQIFVTVKLAGLRYTTLGEIGRTGSQVIFQERATILEAIANAGDIPIEGNRKAVRILRQYPHGQEIHRLDLTDVSVMKSPYYYIQPNDVIIVDPLVQKSLGTGTNGIQTFTTILSIVTVVTSTILLIDRL